jgi:hypothetical protein
VNWHEWLTPIHKFISTLFSRFRAYMRDSVQSQRGIAEILGCHFSWQEGFGAFSVSHSHLNLVINYIRNQENHDRHNPFQQEYLEFLERHEIPYDTRCIFKPVE